MRVVVRNAIVALCLSSAIFAAPAWAQPCRGGVDFAGHKAQGQFGLELEDHSSLFAVSGGLGGSRYFGLALLGVRTYDYREGNTYVFGFGGGRTFSHPLTGGAINCIEVRGDFGTGPDVNGPVRADESSSSLTFELTSGLPFDAGKSVSITPYLGFAARYASVVTTSDLTSNSENDFFELVTIGVGVSASEQFALQPYVQLPLGRDTSEPVFGMRFSMNVGAKR
jgi:hypothetical protein